VLRQSRHVVALTTGERRVFGTAPVSPTDALQITNYRHLPLTRAVISTGLMGAGVEEPFSLVATGHVAQWAGLGTLLMGIEALRHDHVQKPQSSHFALLVLLFAGKLKDFG